MTDYVLHVRLLHNHRNHTSHVTTVHTVSHDYLRCFSYDDAIALRKTLELFDHEYSREATICVTVLDSKHQHRYIPVHELERAYSTMRYLEDAADRMAKAC